MPIQEKLAYSLDKSANLLDVSVQTIRRLINSGDIKTNKVGGRVLITREELVSFLAKQTKRTMKK